ncbi:4'-phosphopantetheinyl transferase family protein [Pseudomonas sp. CCOS 191]|uniref:4'-phosphopantetheinyl transferase family protein n=1 Tax=Pseudomonas sp. CCOS 191 TaxID=1649877 RepID=UPI000624F039|nr:4'-phosphopantetheinyl transferase superfamily protein [Pseudomonas sp. CCOS 191]CRI58566.1 hypothetical protein CCOS191_4030 [Pseudomonas sp. CCOS 191]
MNDPRLMASMPHALATPGSVDLWRLSVAEGRQRVACASYLQWLDHQERTRYQRSTDQGWREQFLIGHGWLREVLARYLECDPARIILGQGRYGKPELLAPKQSSLHFNLSHTQGLLVLAVSRSPVGVDVEAHRYRDVFALCQRFFSEGERRTLSRTTRPRRLACFYRMWTLKEAWVKAAGIGIGWQWRQLRVVRKGTASGLDGPSCWRLAASGSLEGYSIAIAGMSPRAISVRTFVDTALAGFGSSRDNLRWLEYHLDNGNASHMRFINQGVTL